MRLHRIEDGLVRLPEERTLRTHDVGGNPLRDVVDRNTGMCTGVTSNLTIPAGMSVINPTPVSGAKSATTPDVRFDPVREVYYELVRNKATDPFGVVVRTTEDPDGPLPTTRVRLVTAKVPGKGGKSDLGVTPISARKANSDAVKAVLAGMGYTGKITPEIRKACLEMIAIEKACDGARGATRALPRAMRELSGLSKKSGTSGK